MPSAVGAAPDQRLVGGTTYVYHRMQTQILQVTVISGSPISVLQDSRTRSSQELRILQLQITRCFHLTSDDNHETGLFRYQKTTFYSCSCIKPFHLPIKVN